MSATFLIVNPLQFCTCCIRLGVPSCILFVFCCLCFFVPMRVTRGTLVAHRYLYVPPSCRTAQYRRTFIHHSVSLQRFFYIVFDSVRLAGFKTGPMLHFSTELPSHFFSSIDFSCFLLWVGFVGLESSIKQSSVKDNCQ